MHNIPLLLTSQAGAECHAHQCSIICSGQCAVGRLLGGESPYVYDVTVYAHR